MQNLNAEFSSNWMALSIEWLFRNTLGRRVGPVEKISFKYYKYYVSVYLYSLTVFDVALCRVYHTLLFINESLNYLVP